MPAKMYWNTVNPQLKSILDQLMSDDLFSSFRLVGGTSLSLQLGHRMSVDIDMFTDTVYDTIDFESIDKFLADNYPYVYTPIKGPVGMGRAYTVGDNKDDCIKLDLYYTDLFIQPATYLLLLLSTIILSPILLDLPSFNHPPSFTASQNDL